MFGRVRAASSTSLHNLEMERPTSKIFKDDSLSIYEATLMKLKLGSQRNLTSPLEEGVEMESNCSTASASSSMESDSTSTNALKSSQDMITSPDDESAMAVDSDGSSVSDQLSFSATQCTRDSKQQRSRNVSVLYLFSKYNSSRQALTPCREAMMMASNCSASTYDSSTNCQSLSSSKEQSDNECLSSSSICRM